MSAMKTSEDEPMETFVRPSDYDVFIKLKFNAHSNPGQDRIACHQQAHIGW